MTQTAQTMTDRAAAELALAKATTAANLLDEYMEEPEALKILRVHKRTLARLHARREGPPRVRFGKKILYRRVSLIDWLNSREQHQSRARARR